ncbi:MAG: cupin domain-containing protein [Myxococcales bacterium]|nr:cupin domain-containing protein [Myxococcales bacterium]
MSSETVERHQLGEKFASFHEHWRPKVLARLNGQELRAVKTKGVFPWHRHEDSEEMFMVWKGQLRVEFRDRVVTLGPGEFLVVPRGIEHRTASDEEAEVLIFERAEVVNTGDADTSAFTAPQGVEV